MIVGLASGIYHASYTFVLQVLDFFGMYVFCGLLLAVNAVGLAVALYSIDYMKRYTARGYFHGLFLLMVTGMNGVVLAGDLFNLYVFLEVAAVASYALVAFGWLITAWQAAPWVALLPHPAWIRHVPLVLVPVGMIFFVASVSTYVETSNPERELQPGIDLLGPVLEK